MAASNQLFSLEDQGEVFFTNTANSRPIRRLVAEGRARHVYGPVYTKNLNDPIEDVVRRRAWDVAAGYFPGAVITDRTAFEMRPSGREHSIFLSGKTSRVVELPGLVLACRKGPGPVEGDSPFLNGGLHLASWGRRFLDNVRPSRARKTTRRTLSRAELEDKLREVLNRQGEDGLNKIRDEAASVAADLAAEKELDELRALVGALLGTVDSPLETPAARAAAAGRGWDDARLVLFESLGAELLRRADVPRPERKDTSGQTFAFYEAYFSNFIEGTEFTIEEAQEIVFDGVIPEQRPADGHDVAGTFDLVVDPQARRRTPQSAEDLDGVIRAFHARIMAGRPEAAPGRFKTRANRAGNTEFVAPTLVEGTLERGWNVYSSLPTGFARAVFALFLVAEVHPFVDGNGRVARALANAELTAAGSERLIVPTVFREDYLQALRALSRRSNPDPLVRAADRVQAWTHEVEWSSMEVARVGVHETNALNRDDEGLPLRLPSELAARR